MQLVHIYSQSWDKVKGELHPKPNFSGPHSFLVIDQNLHNTVLINISITVWPTKIWMLFFFEFRRQFASGCIYVTWSRGISRISGVLILYYRLREVTSSYVLHCFLNLTEFLQPQPDVRLRWVWIKMQHFKWTSNLCWKIMWIILLDRVTYIMIVSHILFFTTVLCSWFWDSEQNMLNFSFGCSSPLTHRDWESVSDPNLCSGQVVGQWLI